MDQFFNNQMHFNSLTILTLIDCQILNKKANVISMITWMNFTALIVKEKSAVIVCYYQIHNITAIKMYKLKITLGKFNSKIKTIKTILIK